MKLKCIKGTVSCNGVIAEKGDVFEVPDELADGIVKSGFAVVEDASGNDSVTKIVKEVIDEGADEEVVGSVRFDGEITDEPTEATITKKKGMRKKNR